MKFHGWAVQFLFDLQPEEVVICDWELGNGHVRADAVLRKRFKKGGGRIIYQDPAMSIRSVLREKSKSRCCGELWALFAPQILWAEHFVAFLFLVVGIIRFSY